MKFDPKAILAKQGWSEGQGLGRNNQGNKDPIKVTYKFDKTGLGHDFGKDYDAHSAFSLPCDNILQNLKVVPTEDGGVKLVAEVPKQKPEKPNSVGNFVKSTRLNNGELADSSSGHSSDSDSEAENVSTAKKYTDEELFKICGGMTGYSAGKFGISKAAKLARIREQDELAAKNILIQNEKKCVKNKSEEPNTTQDENVSQDSKPKKHKKNKKAKHAEVQENNEDKKCPDDTTAEVVQATDFDDAEPKKKKSKKRDKLAADQEVTEAPKKKSKSIMDDNSPVDATVSSENMIKSKKRKRDHHCDLPETEVPAKKSKSSEEVQIENQEDKPKKKKSKQNRECEELQNAAEETCDDSKPKKIKKKKVAEENEVSTEAVEKDTTKSKKHKKSK